MEKTKKISDHLKKTKRPEIPKDYFAGLSAKLMDEIKKESKNKVIPFYRRPLFWLGSTAAGICIVVGIGYITSGMNKISFDSLSNSEVLAYVEDNIDDFDEELIIDVINEPFDRGIVSDTTKKVNNTIRPITTKNKEAISFESLSREEILEYLNSQEMSLEELEESIEQ